MIALAVIFFGTAKGRTTHTAAVIIASSMRGASSKTPIARPKLGITHSSRTGPKIHPVAKTRAK
jgi:hypothetical protein